MEFDYYSPSETFVALTADQFVGRDDGLLEQQKQDSHVCRRNGSTEKLKNKNLFFKSALLILTVLMNAFPSTNLFCCFSRYQAPANSVAPPSVYKPHTTHNSSICSDEGLTLETSAFESLNGG